MRKIECKNCGKSFLEDDSNPNVHYSSPSDLCPLCEKKYKPTYIEVTFIDRDGRKLKRKIPFINWKNMIEDLKNMEVDIVEELLDHIKYETRRLLKSRDLFLDWGIVYEEGRAFGFGTEEQFDETPTEGN
jgi:hypothetical protein